MLLKIKYFMRAFHFSLGGIIIGMTILGTGTGYYRYMQMDAPAWVANGFYYVIPFFGSCLAILLLGLSIKWIIRLTPPWGRVIGINNEKHLETAGRRS